MKVGEGEISFRDPGEGSRQRAKKEEENKQIDVSTIDFKPFNKKST